MLVVDPIDGTRPGARGLRGGLRVGGRRPAGRRRADDGRRHRRGASSRSRPGASTSRCGAAGWSPPTPFGCRPTTDLDRLFWTFGFRGRPARELIEVVGDLIDRSSVGGGVFDLGSACFDSVCVLTGQLDAFLEPGPRMIDEVPSTRAAFERVGDGAVLNNSPYDLAAAVLCLRGGRRGRH